MIVVVVVVVVVCVVIIIAVVVFIPVVTVVVVIVVLDLSSKATHIAAMATAIRRRASRDRSKQTGDHPQQMRLEFLNEIYIFLI